MKVECTIFISTIIKYVNVRHKPLLHVSTCDKQQHLFSHSVVRYATDLGQYYKIKCHQIKYHNYVFIVDHMKVLVV